MTNWTSCKNALYYDLVRVPHGHIPAPMVKFWGWFPLPIKDKRTYNTFICPNCGSPSFFKVWDSCNWCQYYDEEFYDRTYINQKREKWRRRWKDLEYALLPLLVLLGKAWYMRSERYNIRDYMRGRVPKPEPIAYDPYPYQQKILEDYEKEEAPP